MLLFKNAIKGAIVTAALGISSAQANEVQIPSGKYVLDPTHASLVWKINHFGLSNYTARFTKFDISLNLNVNSAEKSVVSASIDPTSVETDYPGETDFNAEISDDPKFLNSKDFPSIKFTSKRVELTGKNTALIHGDMTLLGVTKTILLEATLNGTLPEHPYAKVPAVGFRATGTIKRSDFGFDYLVPYVGDDVSFTIEAEFLKAQ